MRPGTYKHIYNTDVAMHVLKSYWIPEKSGWVVKVRWFNIVNPKNVFLIDVDVEKHFIPRDKAKDWEVYDVR